jgi:hypothetical protein
MTFKLILYGFIYATFGLGVSHTGFRAGPNAKACRAWPTGRRLEPMNGDH